MSVLQIASLPPTDFLTVVIAGQHFGIPVQQVQDVLGPQTLTHVPLAPGHVLGVMNLRGRVVTAIGPHQLLNLQTTAATEPMFVVVVFQDELYGLMVDEVGDVTKVENETIEPVPSHIDKKWRSLASGILRSEARLTVLLDIPQLIEHETGGE